jgi:class 3 adenylate cyclase
LIERDELDRAAPLLHALSLETEAQELMTEGWAILRYALASGDVKRSAEAIPLLGRATSWRFGFPQLIVPVVEALVRTGAADQAKQIMGEVVVPHESANRPILDGANGLIAFDEGDNDRARALLAQSADGFYEAGYRIDAMCVRLYLVRALERLGSRDEAQAQLDVVIREAIDCGARLRVREAVELADRLGLDAQLAGEEVAPKTEPELVEAGERFVTSMFADVRGYTAMTNERPPQDMVDSIASFYRWAQEEIQKRGGVVDKFAGDAVMATFNVSGRMIDHTVRALEAAMAFQDKAGMMGLPVGVGLAVGSAIIGRFTEGANISVLGETTNLAARLQAMAKAGEVALSDEAYRRTKDYLESRGLTVDPVSVELKGFASPVSAFLVRART